MLYITLTHILRGIIDFYHGVYHTHMHPKGYNRVLSWCISHITLTHIIKGIIEFYHGVYHTHTHPKGYNRDLSWCISHLHTS